ncbi:response regulator [Spirosoma sp. HMF4905]|uniref:Response regulator n=1 Tax=Spirosoma arboris TaxID=2682092 RepID=A0A7K1S9E3_9BACT|nr:response regulator [Spirosoma arboris]MVM30454.1 response regulator [Spirosoma arboris]
MLYLVDDAADYRFLVQQVFSLFLPAYALRFFVDGQELLAYVEQQAPLVPKLATGSVGAGLIVPDLTRPGLIVLDMDMPGLGGLQTLERLKQYPLWQSIPVVLMSHRIEPELLERAYQLGANAYLSKPMELVELKDTLEQLCHQWLDG